MGAQLGRGSPSSRAGVAWSGPACPVGLASQQAHGHESRIAEARAQSNGPFPPSNFSRPSAWVVRWLTWLLNPASARRTTPASRSVRSTASTPLLMNRTTTRKSSSSSTRPSASTATPVSKPVPSMRSFRRIRFRLSGWSSPSSTLATSTAPSEIEKRERQVAACPSCRPEPSR